ncbi:MAG: ammonium transporter [Gemmataceae bacterium]|nr:ammonium transporter [Gemmataceae bacterium]MDW8264995.1 ammonium transporter [Gemmataceae bacterium]
MGRLRSSLLLALVGVVLLGWAVGGARADEPPPAAAAGPSASDLKIVADTMWVLVAAFLVFFMNTGFGCVEAGFCRAKNATNILGKNFVVFAISSLAFWAVGWTLMFSDGNEYFGYHGWFLSGADNSPATGDAYQGVYSAINWTGVPLLAKFFFQLVFAGTAATIVSGCVAERIHYKSFMIFSVFLAAISYPVTGHWIWGGGWLAKIDPGFWDFAGSTVVHSVGGWAGLAGILLLGPRLGKYRPQGGIQPIPGHSMALAFLGGMILWLGWFGFNPGSTMAADPAAISHIVITTNMACAAGMLAATVIAWLILGKPDFSMTVNGALAGLVAITAPCAWVSVPSAVIIGVVGGILVVLAVLMFDRLRIDDPVGALSVHLVNGMWGTLAVGLFADPALLGYEAGKAGPLAGLLTSGDARQLVTQLIGIGTVGAFTFVGSLVVWTVIKVVFGLRVEPSAEIAGLDLTEMGMEAYSGFQVSDPHEHTLPTSEPRPAMAPPGSRERFSVVVEGLSPEVLSRVWSDLCRPNGPPPAEFLAVYPYMTTLSGNRFTFRSGDPEAVARSLSQLFQKQASGGEGVRVRVER